MDLYVSIWLICNINQLPTSHLRIENSYSYVCNIKIDWKPVQNPPRRRTNLFHRRPPPFYFTCFETLTVDGILHKVCRRFCCASGQVFSSSSLTIVVLSFARFERGVQEILRFYKVSRKWVIQIEYICKVWCEGNLILLSLLGGVSQLCKVTSLRPCLWPCTVTFPNYRSLGVASGRHELLLWRFIGLFT